MMETSPENETLAASLAQDLRGIVGKLKRRLRAQASAGDLTPSQSSVLLRLERGGPQTASSLARAEAMRSQSMRAVVAALQAAGMVTSVPDPADGRQTILMLSDACRERLKAGRAARQDWLTAAIQARLTPEEQQRLEAALPLLRRLADD